MYCLHIIMDLLKKIALKSNKQTLFIEVNEIVLVKALNIYCNIYLVNGEKILITETLSIIEKHLLKNNFYKTHRSYLININYIKSYNKLNQKLELKTIHDLIPISRDKKKDFEQFLTTCF